MKQISPKYLRVRIMLIICTVIIPLYILIGFFGLNTIENMNKAAEVVYSRELETFCNYIDSDISLLSIRNDQIQTDLVIEILKLREGNVRGNEIYELWNAIRETRKISKYIDIGYLKLPGTNLVRLTHNTDSISVIDVNTVQAALAKVNLAEYRTGKISDIKIGDKNYLIWNVNINEISYGYLISENVFLKGLPQSEHGENDRVLRKDGTILWNSNTEISTGISLNNTIQEGAYNIERIIPRDDASIIGMILLTLAMIVTILFIPLEWKLLRYEVLTPMKKLNVGMKEIKNNNIDYRVSMEGPSEDFIYLSRSFNEMADEIKKLRIETYESEIEKLRMEAINLKLQVNPHLLLNSLNMIFSLSQSKNYSLIQEYTIYLMEYFRYSLRNNDELVKLESEMQFVNAFLKVQMIRFPKTIEGTYQYSEDIKDILVPPLLIENFVENAVKHGREAGELLHVHTKIEESDGEIMITVSDDGNGMNENILDMLQTGEIPTDEFGFHLGVWICRRRMKLFYGDSAKLEIESKLGVGTTVTIILPILRKDIVNDIADC